MKATDNQIMMAAAQIASGLFGNFDPIKEVDIIAKVSVNIAQKIALEINVEKDANGYSKQELQQIMDKYIGDEVISKTKLEGRLSTGLNITNKFASNIIAQAEFEGIIVENKNSNSPLERITYHLRDFDAAPF